MPGLYGGFGGRGYTQFPKSQGLRLFPKDISDPLYALRRYLCLQPARKAGHQPGPPLLAGEFIPEIIGETPIILEAWEDVPVFAYIGLGGLVTGGVALIEIVHTIGDYSASGGLIVGGTVDPVITSKIYPPTSGGLTVGGTVNPVLTTKAYSTTGGMTLGGTANPVLTTKAYPITAGGMTFGGGATTSYEPDVSLLLSNLVAFWKLNEASGATRLDSVGSNDLTDHNTVVGSPGLISNAASFNGTNQWLDRADNADLSVPNSQSFTIALWMNITTLVNGATPLNKGQLIFSSADVEYALEFYQATIIAPVNLIFIINHETSPVAANAGLLTTGAWHFVVAWYDVADTSINIQVDNGAIFGSTGSTGSEDLGYAFNLGSSGAGGAFFPGLLDAVGLWKRVLTAGEKTYLYNAGSGREYPFV